MLITDAYSKNG